MPPSRHLVLVSYSLPLEYLRPVEGCGIEAIYHGRCAHTVS